MKTEKLLKLQYLFLLIFILALLFLFVKFCIYKPIYQRGYYQGEVDAAKLILENVRTKGYSDIIISHKGEYDSGTVYEYYDKCQDKPDYCNLFGRNYLNLSIFEYHTQDFTGIGTKSK